MEYYKDGNIETDPSLPNVSNATHQMRLDAGWKEVARNKPDSSNYNSDYEKLVIDSETEETDQYTIDYVVTHKSDTEIQELRTQAYREEADSIYFQAQRDDEPETMTDWENKVDEIKNRYPKEDEV